MIDYDPHDWRSHLWDIKGSMVREITLRVFSCVAWSAVLAWIHIRFHPIGIPATIHSLIGVALGLLLVFRTNASYDRFWEGRKMWGSIINESRNLARFARAALEKAPQARDQAIRWTVCFVYAAMHSLRGQRNLGPLADSMPPETVREVLAASHVPSAAAGQISKQWFEARDAGAISDIILVALDQNVQQMIDYVGACERIHRTPLPFAYVVHLRRAVLIYCYTLPLALVQEFGWFTVLGTLIVAYILTGIEEIGVEIEDPFGSDENDLPLERFARMIQANILNETQTPQQQEVG